MNGAVVSFWAQLNGSVKKAARFFVKRKEEVFIHGLGDHAYKHINHVNLLTKVLSLKFLFNIKLIASQPCLLP